MITAISDEPRSTACVLFLQDLARRGNHEIEPGMHIVTAQDGKPKEGPDQAGWLRRLADRADVVDAARALRSFEMCAVERGSSNQKVSVGREDEVGRRLANLLPALATLTSDLDSLIPAWIARLREQLETMRQNGQRHLNALAAREKMPAIDFGNIIAVGQLQIVLQAAGEQIDPHISPIIDDLATLDCELDDHLLAVLEYAGPAVAAAIPKLLHMLREARNHTVAVSPGAVLANASRFDEGVPSAHRDAVRRARSCATCRDRSPRCDRAGRTVGGRSTSGASQRQRGGSRRSGRGVHGCNDEA